VGLEEPENGVHPTRLDLVAEYLKTRQFVGDSQFIVTTHSPYLLDCLPLAGLYVCRRRQGQTALDPFQFTPEGKAAAAEVERLSDADEEPTPISARVLRGRWNA
jgi:predicted ATPase